MNINDTMNMNAEELKQIIAETDNQSIMDNKEELISWFDWGIVVAEEEKDNEAKELLCSMKNTVVNAETPGVIRQIFIDYIDNHEERFPVMAA